MRFAGQDSDRGAAETVVPNRPADPLKMGHVALEQGDLDAVVADRLEPLEQREVRLVDVRRPQQQVEPGLHVCPPDGRVRRRLPGATAALRMTF